MSPETHTTNVWVTRDEEPQGPLSSAISDAGLHPVLEPVIERHLVGDADEAISQLCFDDWLILTSVFAVESIPLESSRVPRVAVVGGASAEAARERGLRVELVGSGGAGVLFQELQEHVKDGTVCYPRSSLAREPQGWENVKIVSPVLYETVARSFDLSVADRVDVIAVASPSAVDAVVNALDEADSVAIDLPFASIGSTTSAALDRHGLKAWIEAPDRRLASLAGAIASRSAELLR